MRNVKGVKNKVPDQKNEKEVSFEFNQVDKINMKPVFKSNQRVVANEKSRSRRSKVARKRDTSPLANGSSKVKHKKPEEERSNNPGKFN